MPNRILKESVCYSDNVNTLSLFQENMFFRLIVNCDDYGRMDARPAVVKAKLYPLKDYRLDQIEDALQALSSAELVILYKVDGKPFLQMRTWDKHQTIRAKKSKYPSPQDGEITSESICKQMQADECKCSRNPIQSESESESNPNDCAAAFERFWAAYPRHTNKRQAVKAFEKLKPDEAMLGVMLAAIEKQKNSQQWTKDGGQFIPHPATWLNGCRWEDEMPNGNAGKQVTAQQYGQRDYTEEELLAVSDDLIAEARRNREENG